MCPQKLYSNPNQYISCKAGPTTTTAESELHTLNFECCAEHKKRKEEKRKELHIKKPYCGSINGGCFKPAVVNPNSNQFNHEGETEYSPILKSETPNGMHVVRCISKQINQIFTHTFVRCAFVFSFAEPQNMNSNRLTGRCNK